MPILQPTLPLKLNAPVINVRLRSESYRSSLYYPLLTFATMKDSSSARAVVWTMHLWWAAQVVVGAFTTNRLAMPRPMPESRLSLSYSGQDDPAVEALRSLTDFHEGRWKGKARSFSVVPDTAAGVVQRKVSPDYEVSAKLGLNSDKDYSLTETFTWNDGNVKARFLSLSECSVDVDSVDASYSLDVALPDFPSDVIGTDKICQFAIEHCIAASEDKRMRCFILYSMDQSLQRVVVCEETRVKEKTLASRQMESTQGESNGLTAQDLIEMQNDVDRLVDKLTGNMKNSDTPAQSPSPSPDSLFERLGQSMGSDDGAQQLSLHDISLLEASSGVWLGDAIIRDNPRVPDGTSSGGRGFGDSPAASSLSSSKSKARFADWSVGVQKVAWRWMWNFGTEIRQVVDVGKAMGDNLAGCLSKSQTGSVCVNESLSRRMPKEDRMVYIDWAADMVGFLVGPAYIKVPRYLSFETKASNSRQFHTEFGIFQSTKVESEGESTPVSVDMDGDDEELELPSLCFSKISRVYNHDGSLKQGSTSFYTFKRFGIDEMDQ